MKARYLFRAQNRRQERIELDRSKRSRHVEQNNSEPMSDRRIEKVWAKYEPGEQDKLGPVERQLISRVLSEEGNLQMQLISA